MPDKCSNVFAPNLGHIQAVASVLQEVQQLVTGEQVGLIRSRRLVPGA